MVLPYTILSLWYYNISFSSTAFNAASAEMASCSASFGEVEAGPDDSKEQDDLSRSNSLSSVMALAIGSMDTVTSSKANRTSINVDRRQGMKVWHVLPGTDR